ncbi:MAG: rRNA maturation RNase YbeY [Candidatus Moranbacteria bacterium]|nr:rRNA maturation RNase YbeY [Candidatus Moranbacteria bacterium]
MHLTAELVKRTPAAIGKPFIITVIKETLIASGYDALGNGNISVSVVFVSAEEIQKLNKEYRRKNKVTDVLSFPEYPSRKELLAETAESIFLGDLIICYDYIVQAAVEDAVCLEQEMAYIVSHGVLHLLGFRHSKKMFALQDAVSEVYAL